MSEGAANWVRSQTSDMTNRCRSTKSMVSDFATSRVSTARWSPRSASASASACAADALRGSEERHSAAISRKRPR